MSNNNLPKIMLTATLNPGASIGEINAAIKALEKKVNKLQLNVEINDKVLKTLNNFTNEMKKISDVARNTGKVIEEALMPDGSKIKRTYFNGVKGEFQQIVTDSKKAKDSITGVTSELNKEKVSAQQLVGEYDKLTREVEKYNSAGKKISSVLTASNIHGTQTRTVNVNPNGDVTSFKDTTNYAKDEQITQRLIQEKAQLKQQIEALGNAGNVTAEQLAKVNQSLGMVKDLPSLDAAKQKYAELAEKANLAEQMAKAREQANAKANELDTKAAQAQDQAINRNIEQAQKELQEKKLLTQEIERQLALYQREKQLQVTDLTRRYGNTIDTNALQNNLNRAMTIDPSSFSSLRDFRNLQSDINLGFREITSNVRTTSSNVSGFGDALQSSLKALPVWITATTAFYQSLRFFKDGIAYVNELNKSLTQISIVTGRSQEQVAGLGTEYNKLAGNMGVLTQDIASASVEFYRQGLSQEQVMERVAVATQYAKISNSDFTQSAEVLTATVNSMNVPIKKASDVFTYLGDATATSSQEIGVAFQKVGGTAGALNIQFEKVASWIAEVSSRTREGAETIGQSIKSILARVQNMKEKGFDEQDGTKINTVAKALSAVGIALTDSHGQFRDFGKVMDEVGAKWQSLDSRQKAYLSTTIAGTYQQSRFMTLMDNYKDSVNLYEQSLDAAGTTQKKFDLYLQSNEAQINKLKVAWEGLWQSSFNSSAIRTAAGGLEVIAKGLNLIVDNVGLLPTVIGIGTLAFFAFNSTIRSNIMSFGALSTSLVRTGDSMVIATGASRMYQIGLYNLTLAARGVEAAIATVGVAARGTMTFLATTALPIAGFMALSYAISLVTDKIIQQREEDKKLEQQIKRNNDTSANTLKNNGQHLDDLISKYKTLSEQKQTGKWDDTSQKEYLKTTQELANIFPNLVSFIDDKGKAHLVEAKSIDKVIASTEKMIELKRVEAKLKAPDNFDNARDKASSNDKKIEMAQASLKDYENNAKNDPFKVLRDTAAKDANETKIRLQNLQNQASQFYQELNAEVFKLADATHDIKITIDPTIKQQLAEFNSSLNFNKLDNSQLTKVANSFAKAMDEMSLAKQTNDANAYKKSIDDLITSLQGIGGKGLKDFHSSITGNDNALKNSSVATNNVIDTNQKLASATADATNSIDNQTDSLKKSADATWQNASASEILYGATTDQIKNIEQAIYIYDLLSKVQNKSEVQQKMYAQAIDFLKKQYPQLNGQIENNIKYIKTQANAYNILNDASSTAKDKQIANEFLMSKATFNGTQQRIANIKKQIQALDVLKTAYDRSADSLTNMVSKNDGMLTDNQASKMLAEASNIKKRQGYQDLVSQLDGLNKDLKQATTVKQTDLGKKVNAIADDKKKKPQDKSSKDKVEPYHIDKYKQSLADLDLALQQSELRMSRLADTSAAYRKELQLQIDLTKKKQAIERQEIKDYDSEYAKLKAKLSKTKKTADKNDILKKMEENRSNKTSLQSAIIGDQKKIEDLTRNIYSSTIGEIVSKNEAKTKSYNTAIDKLNASLDKSDKLVSNLSESSVEYQKELQNQINLQNQIQQQHQTEIKNLNDENVALQAKLKTIKDPALRKQIQDKIDSNNKEKNGLTGKILDSQYTVTQDTNKISSSQIAVIDEKISELRSLQDLNDLGNDTNKVSQNLDLEKQIIAQAKEKQNLITNQIALLTTEAEKNKNNKDKYEEINASIKEKQKLLSDSNILIAQEEKKLADARSEVADKVIDAEKKYYETKRDYALQAIQDEEDAFNKAYDDKMRMYDDELSKINNIYDAKIKSINDTKDKEDYDRELAKKQKDAQDIQDKINKLSLDDSLDAKAKREDLAKQLADKQNEISDYVRDHNIKSQIDALNDEKKLKTDAIDNQKKQDDEAKAAFEDNINQRKKTTQQYYDDILNDEKAWSTKHDQIVNDMINGDLSTVKSFVSDVSLHMDNLNEVIKSNLLDTLQETLSLINQINMTPVKSPSSSTSTTKQTTSSSSTSTIKKFDTGGYTGDFDGGKLAVLHQKEIVLNKQDTSNILSVVSMVRNLVGKNGVSSLVKPVDISSNMSSVRTVGRIPDNIFNNSTNSNATNIEVNLHVENMNGTKKDAENALDVIRNGLKNKGLVTTIR